MQTLPDSATLEGTVDSVVYESAGSDYKVLKVSVAGEHEPVLAVGDFVGVGPGESLRIEGRWQEHPRFGRQLKMERFTVLVPATAKGIEKYLGSGMVPGIGPTFARRIVKAFGAETLNILENDPQKLRSVPGIGKKRVESLVHAWQEHRGIREVMVFLQGVGVGTAHAARIFRTYGPGAISIVKANPYRLALDIMGIGFKTADGIARNLGISADAPQRVEAGVLYVLEELSGEGHTCFPVDDLAMRAVGILGVGREAVDAAIQAQRQAGGLVVEQIAGEPSAYLARLYDQELAVAAGLKRLAVASVRLGEIDAPAAIAWAERRAAIALAEGQKQAIRKALASNITVITGGPGVGKTTVVNCLMMILQAKKQHVMLAAPTGRAARRLAETTGRDAKTIHRLLKYNPRDNAFGFGEKQPLDADAVIVDEASMIDVPLMAHLLGAVPSGCKLVLVGDVDQLPSVGPGNLLHDIISSGIAAVVRLTEIFRQARSSLIVINAHRINAGEFPFIKPREGHTGEPDFFFIQKEDPAEVVETIKQLCSKRIPAKFGLHPLDDIQVITPMHKGEVGASNLNTQLQACLNPDRGGPGAFSLNRAGKAYRLGDKVMQLRNNYDKDVYNGDIGRIVGFNRIDQELLVRFYDRQVSFKFSELDELTHAYAISVHKSQGSEYPAVVMPLLTQHYLLLQRNLIYTALTRARKLAVIVGTTKALGMAVGNDRIRRRYTHLAERLAQSASA